MSYPKRAYSLISKPSSSGRDFISPILIFCCLNCGESSHWLKTMYREKNRKPYTRLMCLGCYHTKGKWLTDKEAEAIYSRQIERGD